MSNDDTAASTVPAGPPEALPPPRHGRSWASHKGWIAAGVVITMLVGVTLVVTLVKASVVGIDEYIVAPGSATDTASAVVVRGAERYEPEGEINFTTVTIRRSITLWEWFWARYDDASELVPAESIDGDRSREETRQVTQFQMDQSQDTATLVALEFLGYEVVPEVQGAFVLELVPDSPAEAVLELGDLITDVEGQPVRSSEDLGEAIRSFAPGDTVDISLRRAQADGGRDGSDDDAEPIDLTITLAEHPDVPGSGFLGVRIETPIRADAPFEVGFEVGRVRGPSAGLAFSLAIIDVLSEGELTGGLKIATTGTIDRFGIVGAVGGVPQKIEAARRSGIELFLVPPSEYLDAVDVAGDSLDVACVQTLDDAVLELAELGGNGLEVVEAFGAPVPEHSPSPIDPDDGFLSCAEVTGQPEPSAPGGAELATGDPDQASEGSQLGTWTVGSGDTLESIAASALAEGGRPDASQEEIEAYAAAIRDLNADDLGSADPSQELDAGQVLDLPAVPSP